MLSEEQSGFVIPTGLSLRNELSLRSLRLAASSGHLHERTDGRVPSILFGQDEYGRHGNFHPDAYAAILQREDWAKRLEKVHTASKRMKPRSDWQWKELDCSNSSDALLMNIFCHPGTMASGSLQRLLNVEGNAELEFGFKPRVPLQRAKSDATEVDLRLSDLLIEAKLTESDFQWAAPKLVSRYCDLGTVFDLSQLPMREGRHAGYQLIRGTLAAYALGCSFCVFCDARRPDLIETWFRVMRAVISSELRCRLKLLTWQELAPYLPQDLQDFLSVKYGIFPTS
jgi:hypothetical protein